MDSSESISFSMDTTTDSIDVMDHFHSTTAKSNATNRDNSRQSPRKHARMLLREHNNENYDQAKEDLAHKKPPDKLIVVDETPPPSTGPSSSSSSSSSTSPSSTSSSTISNSSLQSSTTTATTNSDCPLASLSQPIIVHCPDTIKQEAAQSASASTTPTKSKKSVLFNNVTVYHFNRSQGFTSIPSQGGSTLGMKQKHFLRRRLSVDLYEEVRRRSRRDILLKIKYEKRKKDEQARLEQQRKLNDRLKIEGSSTSSSASNTTNASDSDDSEQVRENNNLDVDDDEFFSDFSDISDSELEGDSYIFLQPLGVKVRRTLLRASGVGRIDPSEKRDCKKIRDSRDRSGCKCVDRCIPKYCECSLLGVKCHVDRVSYPCGCNSVGCQNPEGRSEFDISRVRNHFIEKVIKGDSCLSDGSNDAGDSEPQTSPEPKLGEEIC